MTVSYSLSTSRAGVLTFPRLLFRWRGSIYKLVYVELFIYLMFYFALSFTYRFALNAYQRTLFEEVCGFFSDIFLDVIPLSFLMGFYVALVAARWWNMYSAIPYIDGISQIFATYIRGNDDVTRMQRRSLVRWITLTSTIVFTSVSPPVLKRFPTCLHLVKAGLMTESERKTYEHMPTPHVKWWLPISWCCNLVGRLKADGKVDGEMADLLLKEIQAHRQACGAMMDYDWISIPLVYTQVVTIATYTFFLAKLFSSQFLESSTEVDLYFPIILVFEFLFYFGWLKVAEVIINPYGDDDDDFEINYILDRTYQIGLLIVDDCYDMVPELEKDKYWVTPDFCLPNCKSTTADNQGKAWLGSTVPGGLLLSAKHFILGHTWNGFAKNINHKYSAAKVALQMTPGVDPQTEISASSDYDQTWAAKREAGFNGNDDDIPMQELPDKSIDDKPRKYELRLSKKGPSNDTVEVKMPCGVCLGIKEGTLKEVEHLDHPTK